MLIKGKMGPELAEELFLANYNCAQSTLAGILSAKGRSYEDRIRMAGAFGAGIAQTGGMCGAITGALMAFGYLTPMRGDIGAWKAEVAKVSKEYMARFASEFSDTTCNALSGCDMTVAANRKQFHDGGGRDRICTPMVKRGVEIALEILGSRG